MKNLLYNPSFELWTYPNSAPDGWTFVESYGPGSTIHRSGAVVKVNSYSAQIISNAVQGQYGFISQFLTPASFYFNRKLAVGCWVWCDQASSSRIQINESSTTASSWHPGDSEWHWLQLNHTATSSFANIKALFVTLCSASGYISTGYFDGAVALEGCWVPQTPYDFEDVEFRLGPTSATSIVLYPDEGMELGKHLMHNTQRAADGHLYGYEFGTYHKSSFPVQFMPSSDAAIVNSWWESQAKLLLFVTSGPVTAVHSCMIMGETCPMSQINKPYDDRFKGTIPLEGY
jgi:hypothetical protein